MHGMRSLGLVLLVVALVPASAAAEDDPDATRTYAESFEERLEGWELAGAARIARTEHGRVLRFDGPGHAIWNQVRVDDFRLRCRYRHGEGAGDLVLRGAGEPPEQTEYHVRLHPEGVEILRTAERSERLLARGEARIHSGTWVDLAIEVRGGRVEVSIDGREIVTAEDPRPVSPGMVALGCVDGRGFAYDDVHLETRLAAKNRTPSRAEPGHEAPRASPPPHPALDEPPPRVVPQGPPPEPPVHRAPPYVPPPGDRGRVWHRTGGPLGGLGYDVRIQRAPLDQRIMYVSDAWAGVFKSVDHGRTWFPSNDGITVTFGLTGDGIPVFSLTIDPHDARTIWVGMKDRLGIFKSTDAGAHWTKMDHGVIEQKGITFRGFTVHPYDRNTVYAAAEISSWAWRADKQPTNGRMFDLTRGVVYRTTDGGRNWYAVWRGANLARYVWIDPTNPHTLYLSTGIFDREGIPSSAAPDGGIGVFKSTDNAATWKPATVSLHNRYVGSLFMHPKDPRILLAGTGCNAAERASGVYRTTDGGTTWSHVLATEAVTAVEFAASDPRIAYAGTSRSIYRSADTGHTWRKMTTGAYWGPPGIRAGWPIDFEVDPREPDRLFANAYGGGNFVSTDGGRTWTDASKGYTGALLRGLATDPRDPRVVYAAARSGVFVSRNAGDDWTGLVSAPAATLDWSFVTVDPTTPGHLIASSLWFPGRLVHRRQGDATWTVASTLNDRKLGWRCARFAPSNPNRVYAGTCGVASFGQPDDSLSAAGVWTSPDGGRTWQPARGGAENAHVRALAVDPNHEGHVFAATTNFGLLETLDGGKTWRTRNQGLGPHPVALAVAIHPLYPRILVVGLRGRGLRRSTDGGATWRTWVPGLDPTSSINAIVLDPHEPDRMYVADRVSGVYHKLPGGKRWTPLLAGLANREVRAIALSADGRILYAGTEGAGVFRLRVRP